MPVCVYMIILHTHTHTHTHTHYIYYSTPFYGGFFENYIEFFMEFFDKKIYFVMLHKLAKFHYQTVFSSQVIHQNMFRVSCLGI